MRDVWNLGVKVRDLDAELAFMKACGATDVRRDTIPDNGVDRPLGMAMLGHQRVLMFPTTIYENQLPEPLHHGLTHMVFEVEDVAATLETFRANGIVPFWGPKDSATPFGRRRMVFFRSPSGMIFETFQSI